MNEMQIKNLSESGFYLGQPLHAEIEETHISWVLFTKQYAFKIKKPVRLSFLDFSTLSKRKKYCYQELKLNQRFSPIYFDVLPVYKDNDAWQIGDGHGKVVDYAVWMKRLLFSKRMDKLLMQNKVEKRNVVSLAKVISKFHSSAEVISTTFKIGSASKSFNDIRTIIGSTKNHLGTEYAAIIQRSIEWSNLFLKIHAPRMKARIAEGFTRDVHGDLHSGNIFLYKEPVLFDCIEFNDQYRCIDVLNEIAFLCMDLEAYGKGSLAHIFKHAYQQYSHAFQEEEDERIFQYYKCFRANVRAKVHALAALQEHDDEQYQHHVSAWKNYLQLMQRYLK
ncbi:hypothetical protein [Chryseolinea sp. H1M3-3]|uniref:hypothetical protein n=1 Tax=Chryseolinea sp. H1M3-3 TaxID=3034144 RepID=UPI0023ED280E|nr:hypothetical protein [Chryseolinea sp. H1M3-3]